MRRQRHTLLLPTGLRRCLGNSVTLLGVSPWLAATCFHALVANSMPITVLMIDALRLIRFLR
ncbi:hypothetical protein, partial [Klebsiella pneumoniae]|uniref:hypothetical protein n=1 Tax=Klebsiella pneumoniae TaxID=573 RepID=UPI003013892F